MAGRVKTLWQIMRGQRLRYGGAILAILLSTFFMYLRPLICKGAIDYLIIAEDFKAPAFVRRIIAWLGGRSLLAQNLWIAAGAVVLVTVASGVFMYLKGRWSAVASESIAQRLRDRLYDHLQQLPCSYYDRAQTGDLVQRCTSDVETIRLFLSRQAVEMGRAVILITTVLPIMLSLDLRMTLLSVISIPIIVVFATIFFIKIKSNFQQMDEAEGRMTSQLQENLRGVRVVRAFARQEFERQKFGSSNAEYRQRWSRLIDLMGWYWPLSDVLCVAQVGLVLFSGAYFVAQGDLSVGTLYAFVAYVNIFLWPVRNTGRILAELGKAMVSLSRVQEVLSEKPESDELSVAAKSVPGQSVRGDISFEHVSFSHGQDVPVLKDVSFQVKEGQTLAILGPSGSGKSTLINLLLRLYDYKVGAIRLDGIELRELPRKYVRSQIGVVLQEPFLYSRSLRENIKLGHSSAPDEEMASAAALACIHDSIIDFEKGYDTVVGERGITLSGGQRQRVALARAVLKNPPILILDDALSSVDVKTEQLVLRALRERHGHRTTLVIAHRLTTLAQADMILVLDNGQVAQSGTHSSLLREEGMYSRLWRIQSSLEERLGKDLRQRDGSDA